MGPAVRGHFKLAAVTAAMTTAFWFGAAAWWYQRPTERSHQPALLASTSKVMHRSKPRAWPVPPAVPEPRLSVPVMGVRRDRLIDTFTQARASGARRHDAIDILAPRGTPVVAAAAGKVEKVFQSKDGGNTVYVRSLSGRRLYHYAHLDSYAPGLAEGMTVRQGAAIGTVGTWGNANPAAPHLHFAVWGTAPSRKWWENATARNPYELLR